MTANKPHFGAHPAMINRLVMRFALSCGLLVGAALLPPACTPAVAAVQPARHPHAPAVAEAAQRFGIPELWIWRVMHAESRGKSGAVSPAGAMGLMQIMPATWASLTARHRLGSDPFDPRANILAGAAYLRAMWDRYGDVGLMLAAYNAGPGRVDAYAAGRRGLPAETIAYIAAIAPVLGSKSGTPATAALPSTAPGWRDAGIFTAREKPAAGEVAAAALPSPHSGTGDHPSRAAAASPLFMPVFGKDR